MNISDFPLYRYRAVVDRIVDGDTIQVTLSYGDYIYRTRRIRLLGYNAPELIGETHLQGFESKVALERIIPPGSVVYVETKLDRTNFDRLLAHVYAPGNGEELLDVAAAMIASGYGVAA